MPTVVLQHCIDLEIYASEVPADVDFTVVVGGTTGDGSVDVTATPNAAVPPGPAAPNTTLTSRALGCRSIVLHYHKNPDHPSSIPVTYTLQVN